MQSVSDILSTVDPLNGYAEFSRLPSSFLWWVRFKKPKKPGREKSVFEIWHDLMGDEVYLYWADAVDPTQFDQPWNPAVAIDEWLGLMESREYASVFCLRMIRDTARQALNFLGDRAATWDDAPA